MSNLTKANNPAPPSTQNLDPVTKAAVLLEALPYIQRFRGSIFVIKYGGSFMDDPDPRITDRVITDIVFLASVGIKVVIVHGGGKAITRALEEEGIDVTFRNGMRVTDENSIHVVEQVLNRDVNPSVCNKMQQRGGLPMTLEGNKIFECEKQTYTDAEGNAVDLGYVGAITSVNTDRIFNYIKEDYTPIISPIGEDGENQPYNINADVAAAAVAKALRARRLVYLCDVPGLLSNPDDPETLISTVSVEEVQPLKNKGVIGKGMMPKVDSAVGAIQEGVRRAHFIDARMPHSLLLEIFTNKGIGTEIVHTAEPWRPKPQQDI